MQVNSQNLGALGYSMADTFSPCRNISAGARILAADYVAAAKRIGPGQPALLAALSAYNSGSFTKGFYSGYVSQYFRIPRVRLAVSVKSSRTAHYYIDPNYAPIRVYSRHGHP
jgi:type IV secretion system protein VirB1